jgi:transcriptional regulator with XRE-family HTH domain
MNLPEFLRSHRKNHSLAQKQIAHTLGITREHYARVEEGTQLPSLPLLRRMSKEFQVTIIYIISENESVYRALSDAE